MNIDKFKLCTGPSTDKRSRIHITTSIDSFTLCGDFPGDIYHNNNDIESNKICKGCLNALPRAIVKSYISKKEYPKIGTDIFCIKREDPIGYSYCGNTKTMVDKTNEISYLHSYERKINICNQCKKQIKEKFIIQILQKYNQNHKRIKKEPNTLYFIFFDERTIKNFRYPIPSDLKFIVGVNEKQNYIIDIKHNTVQSFPDFNNEQDIVNKIIQKNSKSINNNQIITVRKASENEKKFNIGLQAIEKNCD